MEYYYPIERRRDQAMDRLKTLKLYSVVPVLKKYSCKRSRIPSKG